MLILVENKYLSIFCTIWMDNRMWGKSIWLVLILWKRKMLKKSCFCYKWSLSPEMWQLINLFQNMLSCNWPCFISEFYLSLVWTWWQWCCSYMWAIDVQITITTCMQNICTFSISFYFLYQSYLSVIHSFEMYQVSYHGNKNPYLSSCQF